MYFYGQLVLTNKVEDFLSSGILIENVVLWHICNYAKKGASGEKNTAQKNFQST